jgi:hypothetical protein
LELAAAGLADHRQMAQFIDDEDLWSGPEPHRVLPAVLVGGAAGASDQVSGVVYIGVGGLFNLGTHPVILADGEPPSVDQARGEMLPWLFNTSGRRCYSYSSLKSTVTRLVAGHRATAGLTPAFAQTQTPLGIQFGRGRQVRYQQGCAVIGDMGMVAGSLTQLDVWVAQSSAPPLAHGLTEPRPSSYR